LNFFPDQLQTTALTFTEPTNIFQMEEGEGSMVFRVAMGTDAGYEAVLYYNGRLLVGFQEMAGGRNEKLDFVWEGYTGKATASNGEVHELKADSNWNVIIWSIKGVNAMGYEVVLRYLRNFYDAFNVLTQSIRYEENAEECQRVYQYFQYGLDDQRWKARKAWVYVYPYPVGNDEYFLTEVPVDILEFPEDFEEKAVEQRHIK
jgi:hypothetical protein